YNKRKNGSFLYEEIIGVLDGQQRLSSIYLGLQGTHATKLKYHRRKNSDAYPKTKLYLNLFHLPYTEGANGDLEFDRTFNFEFRFLTDADAKRLHNTEGTPVYWYLVGNVLKWNDDPDIDSIYDKLVDAHPSEAHRTKFKEQKRFIKKVLRDLHKRLNEPFINFFNIKNDDLEDILEIFIRVNSGVIFLPQTDRLLSVIIGTGAEACDIIDICCQQDNFKGDDFYFDYFVQMRSGLVLC